MTDMITSVVSVQIVDEPKDAPNYTDDRPLLRIDNCIVVGKGTEQGSPTVDLQLKDQHGNDYLIMATGGIIEMIASAVKGKRERDAIQSAH